MGMKYSYEYRIVCQGRHSGRKHVWKKKNLAKAIEDAEAANDDEQNYFQQTYCVPFVVEAREFTEWFLAFSEDEE